MAAGKDQRSTHPFSIKNIIKPDEKFNFLRPKIPHIEGSIPGQVSYSTSSRTAEQKSWMDKRSLALVYLTTGRVTHVHGVNQVTPDSVKPIEEEHRKKIGEIDKISTHTPIQSAINEVMAGAFQLLIFGRDEAPVTALKFMGAGFNPPFRILSRMMRDNCATLKNIFFAESGHGLLYNLKVLDKSTFETTLKEHQLTGLAAAIAFKILIQDNDINFGNFVTSIIKKEGKPPLATAECAKHPTAGKFNVYGIDTAQAFESPREDIFGIISSAENLITEFVSGKDRTLRPEHEPIKEALLPHINMDEVAFLTKRISELSDLDIDSIGINLKNQLGESRVRIDDETSDFIAGRIAKMKEIRNQCIAIHPAHIDAGCSAHFQDMVKKGSPERAVNPSCYSGYQGRHP